MKDRSADPASLEDGIRHSRNCGQIPVKFVMRHDRSFFAGERKKRRRTTAGANPIKLKVFLICKPFIVKVNERAAY
jgi:hypothetical protein